ncbi:fumarylacetoacetate hydrolase family protein [Amycolatopsis sp. lyj-90]|uniref:fumarylacetoacetate hydrolase family protein n=1 Tax=Amycolatopsis sp. lyj-90 TaxID=2789285 RepID=UPI003978F038
MEIRRRLTDEGTLAIETRAFQDTQWVASDPKNAWGYEPAFSQEWEAERATEQHARSNGGVLPFQPLSFRDFMFFEEHNIAAARGYVGRFRPRVAKLVKGFETLTRKNFPRFRPDRLWYQQPTYYMGNMATIVPSGTPVTAPPFTQALDYELELAFVLKAPLLNAHPTEAEDAIGMFVLLCDFSARDVQIPEMDSGFGPQKSKHFLTSLATTAVAAADLLPRWRDLTSRVIINDEVVARPDARGSRWSMGQALAHASAGEQLYPGELFAIGTLTSGCGMEIGRWLRPGDRLRLEMDEVGAIEHTIH